MKTLILVRHAKSSWDDNSLSDFDRPLNDKGNKDAPAMGKLLAEKKVKPDLIISSPANRAISTAGYFAEALNYKKQDILEDESIYTLGYNGIISILQNLNGKVSMVMLFGHNPDMTNLVNNLSDAKIDNVPTAGVFCIDFNFDSWSKLKDKKGKLRFYEIPKKSLK